VNTRQVLTLDLKDDPSAIAAYRKHHRAVWPEVQRSLRRVGIRNMDIYLLDRRLVMVLETPARFDRRRAFARHIGAHPRCAEWEELMTSFQEKPRGARPGEWWARMEPVFLLGRGGRAPGGSRPRRPRP
jgi:L-rhamnose mutarotase